MIQIKAIKKIFKIVLVDLRKYLLLMEQSTQDNGKTVKDMDKEHKFGVMELNI